MRNLILCHCKLSHSQLKQHQQIHKASFWKARRVVIFFCLWISQLNQRLERSCLLFTVDCFWLFRFLSLTQPSNHCSIPSSQPTVNYKEHLWTLISDRTPQPGNPIAHNQAPSSVTPAENWIKKFARASKKIKIYETFLSLEKKKGLFCIFHPCHSQFCSSHPKSSFPPLR